MTDCPKCAELQRRLQQIASLAGVAAIPRVSKPVSPGAKAPYVSASDSLRACTTLAQPFTALQLSGASGCSVSGAKSMFTRWRKKGWIRQVRQGLYERTIQFPGIATPGVIRQPTPPGDKRVSIPGLDPEPIQVQIERAVACMEQAVMEGRDTMAQVYAHKVAKLKALL